MNRIITKKYYYYYIHKNQRWYVELCGPSLFSILWDAIFFICFSFSLSLSFLTFSLFCVLFWGLSLFHSFNNSFSIPLNRVSIQNHIFKSNEKKIIFFKDISTPCFLPFSLSSSHPRRKKKKISLFFVIFLFVLHTLPEI